MKEQFVPIEIASKLKEKGFCDDCLGFYYYDGSFQKYCLVYNESSDEWFKTINAPLWQQVFDWLREKYNIHITIYKSGESYAFDIGDYSTGFNNVSYEEIRLKAIEKALKLI